MNSTGTALADANEPVSVHRERRTEVSELLLRDRQKDATNVDLRPMASFAHPRKEANPPATVVGDQHLDGVIGRVTADLCIIRVSAAGGRRDIPLPAALIPADLQKVGQPVRISLDRSSGVRQPRVEASTEVPSLTDDERKMLDWADKLEC